MLTCTPSLIMYKHPGFASPQKKRRKPTPQSFALDCAFLRMGSILVAFIMSPLILSLPPMNSRCAFALPATSLPKSSSERERVTSFPNVSLQPHNTRVSDCPEETRMQTQKGTRETGVVEMGKWGK